MEKHTPTSYRLSTEARHLLALLAAKLGISQRAALEIAVRGQAKREGIRRVTNEGESVRIATLSMDK